MGVLNLIKVILYQTKLNTIFHVEKESYELCMSLGKILVEAHVKNVFQGGAK
jgi:hypothetical protein